jgi:O-antigen/teichoic acid export membrane protein
VSRRASYRESVAFGGLSTVAMMVLGLVSSIAIARIYGIRTLGAFALAQAPSVALGYLASVREQAALVRHLAVLEPRAPRVTGLFAAVWTFSFGLTVAVSLLTAGATVLLYHGTLDQPDLIWPAVALIAATATLQNVTWNLEMVLSGFRAGRELMIGRVLQAVGFLGLAVAGGLVWDSVWALVVATAGSLLIPFVLRLVQVRAYMRLRVPMEEIRAGFRELPEMLRFGIRLAPSGFANGISTQAGIWLLGAMASVTAVGAYNRAQLLANRFLDASMRLSESLLPTLVERGSGGDRRGYDVAMVDSIRYAAFALFLPAAAGGGAAAGVMDVFGPGFDAAAPALVAVLLVPPLAAISTAQTQALVAADRPLRVTAVTVARCVVTVVVSWVAIRAVGPWGAGAGWAAGYVVAVLWLQLDVNGLLDRPLLELWPLRQLLVLPVAYAAGFVVARALDAGVSGLGGTVLGLALGAAAYLVALVALGGFGDRDRSRWAEVRGRLDRRRGAAAALRSAGS